MRGLEKLVPIADECGIHMAIHPSDRPDHLQPIEGDGGSAHQALAYSIGYIKALLAGLAA